MTVAMIVETIRRRMQLKVYSRSYRFFEKHYKWIAIVSGLVVSLTISLKDHFHERAKDFESQLDSAQSFQQIQDLNTETNSRVEFISRQITELKKNAAGGDPTNTLYALNDQVSLMMFDLKETLAKSKSLETLVTLTGGDEAHTLKQKLVDLDVEMLPLIDTDVPKKSSFTIGELEADRDTKLIKFRDLNEKFNHVRDEFYALLKKRKEENERKELIYSWMSYAIIIVAVSLSIAAKVVEKPTDDSVEVPELKV